MALSAGTTLGPYEIVAPIGAGGMGQVYRARDTKLNREVALKVIPDGFTLDPDRLARFRREAQVLASLNHPNIAAIYGFEESNGVQALVLELVEGPTLADRLTRGPIPLDEALPVARQIAEALTTAHEQEIVHRDLKPANIKLRPDGTVKVLDFGLAKALERAPISGDLSQSPTITSPAMTQMGVILGTAAYMSPEQAKGRAADTRSDVWAFGCVLYEMLTGTRPFDGEDVSDTLAAVLRGEPKWAALPADVSPGIRTLVMRCLERNRKKRIADISTALFVIDEPAIIAAASGAATQPEMPIWRRSTPFLVTAILAGALVGGVAWTLRPSSPPLTVTRFTLPLGEGQQFEHGATDRRDLGGERVSIVEGVSRGGATGAAHFGFSNNGSLVYVPGPISTRQRVLAFLDRTGGAEPLKVQDAAYESPRVSPDGKRIAVGTDDGKAANIWIYDLTGASSMRSSRLAARIGFPSGPRIANTSRFSRIATAIWLSSGSRPTEAGGPNASPSQTAEPPICRSSSSDGKRFLFSATRESNTSLWVMSLPDRTVAPFGDAHSLLETEAVFSPDGRWVAYTTGSGGTGPTSVFVEPFPNTGAKYRIGNGTHPMWSPDGKELFLSTGGRDQIASVSVTTRPAFAFGELTPMPGLLRSGAAGSPFCRGATTSRRTANGSSASSPLDRLCPDNPPLHKFKWSSTGSRS